MSTPRPVPDLHPIRARIAKRLRELRRERRWTQAELGKHLGLSQARLSEVERGDGSFTAEQLIAALALFNVPIREFLPPTDPEDELQNALIQHGATHLRPVAGVATTNQLATPSDVILATLLVSRSPRFVTALAPVLLAHIDAVSLPSLRLTLSESRRENRLGWLLENVREALAATPEGANADWRRRAARATTVLTEELSHFPEPAADTTTPDLFDPTIRSTATRDLVWNDGASPISRRWCVVSELQPADFRDALWSAYEPG